MVLPPVVGGVALLLAFGRRGLVGGWLATTFGIHLPFTTAGAIMAETFVAMPFLVITVEAGLRSMDTRFEDAARTLGARIDSEPELERLVTVAMQVLGEEAPPELELAEEMGAEEPPHQERLTT